VTHVRRSHELSEIELLRDDSIPLVCPSHVLINLCRTTGATVPCSVWEESTASFMVPDLGEWQVEREVEGKDDPGHQGDEDGERSVLEVRQLHLH